MRKRAWSRRFFVGCLKIQFFAILAASGLAALANATTLDMEQAPGATGRLQQPPSLSGTTAQGPFRLPLQEAIVMALLANRDIEVSSYEPLRSRQELDGAKAVYDPSFFANYSHSQTDRPIQSELDTGSFLEEALIEDRESLQAGFRKRISTGGTFAIFQEVYRLDSNSTLVTPNPQYQSRATAELTQPLLQGVGDKANRSTIRIAKLNVAISDAAFRQRILDVVAEVSRTYWQLAFARETVRIGRHSLDLAKEVHRQEVVRLEKGISKPLNVDRALAAVESRRSDLGRAKNRVEALTRQLRLLLDPSVTDASDVNWEGILLDEPRLEVAELESASAVAQALNQRPELEIARKSVDVTGIRKELAGHMRLPRLDAIFSYTLNGLTGEYDDMLDGAYGTDTNSWAGLLEFEWPLGGRSAAAGYRKAGYEEDQARARASRAAEQIALEVNLAIEEVRLAKAEIKATSEAMKASERVVRGENARFELGQTTNEELLRSQDLFAANEREFHRAVANYNIALVALGRAKGTLLKEQEIMIERE